MPSANTDSWLRRAAGKHVEKPEQSPLGGLEKGRQGLGVDAGRGDVRPNPVDRKQQQTLP